MSLVPAASPQAQVALDVVRPLQRRLAEGAAALSTRHGHPATPRSVPWLRDDGRHGGGDRLTLIDTGVWLTASVNVSQVHYDDLPDKRLASATALSAILHPTHPRAPSVHLHISLTELRDGRATWRLMADLNPAIPDEADRTAFDEALAEVAGDHLDHGRAQGEHYFAIPALHRLRGISHFYLEGHSTGDEAADAAFATRFGEHIIDTYLGLVDRHLDGTGAPTAAERAQQLAYHTVYFFQVLTLDRGTTSGLLIHDQNDVGILGSLPPAVDRALLASWADRVPEPQDALVHTLVDALPDAEPAPVDEPTKRRLAGVLRSHYAAHPEALALQARGFTVPTTVSNHDSGDDGLGSR